jgi:hypothetical protein
MLMMLMLLVMMFLTLFFCLTIKKDFVIHIVGVHTSIGTGAVVSSSIAGTRTTSLS